MKNTLPRLYVSTALGFLVLHVGECVHAAAAGIEEPTPSVPAALPHPPSEESDAEDAFFEQQAEVLRSKLTKMQGDLEVLLQKTPQSLWL